MNVTLLTMGSRGDVQPYVALARGLRRAGHQVRLATHASFESFVRSQGLDFAPLAGDPREILAGEAGKAMLESRDPVTFLRRFIAVGRDIAPLLLEDARSALAGSEAVIYSTLAFVGHHVAEQLDIPAIAAHLQPIGQTGAFPYMMFPQSPSLGSGYNRATHALSEWLTLRAFAPMTARWRQELGLPPVTIREATRLRIPTLHGYSPQVVPTPADWGAWHHVTGYWFLEAPGDWQPPDELVSFLAAGSPPVCVGFGSMGSRDPAGTTRVVLEALRRAGRRGLLLGGWGGFDLSGLPPEVFALDEAPHDWLFPRMAAVVSHGGAGTTGASLRAGVPTILTPYGMDQPFWGHRVAQLGVGPAPIPRKRLTAKRLAIAIEAACEDPKIQERAGSLGERIRAEHGVERAVEAFERITAAAAAARR